MPPSTTSVKGEAIYFESAVTLGYFKRNNPLVQQWIIDPAMKVQAHALVQVKKAPSTVGFRGLLSTTGPVAILTNWGDTDTVVVSSRGDYAVADTLTGAPVEVTHPQGATVATEVLPAGAVSLLRASKSGE